MEFDDGQRDVRGRHYERASLADLRSGGHASLDRKLQLGHDDAGLDDILVDPQLAWTPPWTRSAQTAAM